MSEGVQRIDAHQHFWQVARGDYGWLTPELETLYRDFLPPDYKPFLDAHGIVGTVLVQAAPTVSETEYLLSLADCNSFVKGVVGWVDFEAPDAAGEIARLAGHPKLVGFRPMIQDIAEDGWMLKPELTPAFEAMTAHGLTFDALTKPRHLKNLLTLLEGHSGLRVVIDHGSKPDIRSGAFQDWAADMEALALRTSTWCKISGLVTEAADDWTVDDLKPYVDHLLTVFGPTRLIWGSDWPVCTFAATFADWVGATEELLSGLSDADRKCIWYRNAVVAYGLDLQP